MLAYRGISFPAKVVKKVVKPGGVPLGKFVQNPFIFLGKKLLSTAFNGH